MTTNSQIEFEVNGMPVAVPDQGLTLLEVLRDHAGVRSPKDGCSPQGQCGCCTVMVDDQPRVACVTPARRVAGRSIATVETLDDAEDFANALCATGGSQCGFCTPGIVVRLSGLRAKKGELTDASVREALKAHLCRCTGWQTIVEAALLVEACHTDLPAHRDLDAAAARATIEGGAPQQVSPEVALGLGGFADDEAPAEAQVAVRGSDGQWVLGAGLSSARAAGSKVQGRRTTADASHPIAVPEGDWDATLQTMWVEPGYLETDASWALPGGEAASPLANGGAFGGKVASTITDDARELANQHGTAVRALYSREDTVRLGPKRPPLAGGMNADGSGHIVVARTPGIAEAIRVAAPDVEVTEVDVAGPPTSANIRAAGWAEVVALQAAARGSVGWVRNPKGGEATAEISDEGIAVTVRCGAVLDEVVLRSYCIGAAHMAYSWVTSESLVVADDGEVHDLTVRSFGIVRAVDTPTISVTIEADDGKAVNGSDAVFAAVVAATWEWRGWSPAWPTG